MQLPAAGSEFPGGLQLGDRLVPPVGGPVGPGAGGVPAFLPRLPRVQLKPVEDLQHGQLPRVPGVDVLGEERRCQHPPHHREPACGRRLPGRRDRSGGNLPITARASALSCRAAAARMSAAVTSVPFRTARPGSRAGSPAPAPGQLAGARTGGGGGPAWPR